MRRLQLDIYLPEFRATILEVSVRNFSDDPFGRLISGALKVEGGYRAIESWQVATNVVYNDCPSKMILHYRWAESKILKSLRWFKLVPPGHVLCTLDESIPDNARGPDYEMETHADLVRRKVVCLQIAKFGHHRDGGAFKTDEEAANVFALMLEDSQVRSATCH